MKLVKYTTHGYRFKTKRGDEITTGYCKSDRQFTIHVKRKNGDVETLTLTPQAYKMLAGKMIGLSIKHNQRKIRGS